MDAKSAENLRVALFCANFDGVPDGASKVLHRLVDFLLARGATVRVYSAAVAKSPGSRAVEVVAVPSIPIPRRPEYRISLGLTHRLRADVKQYRPSLVHISVPDLLGTPTQALAHRLGIPVVASMHTRFETYLSYYGLGFLRPLVERRLRRFYAGCDAVLVPNEAIAGEFRARGWARNVHVWRRGVDRSLFNPRRRSAQWRCERGFAEEDVVLLFFGRLVREKGLDVFVATVEKLRRRGTRFRLLVVGDGPERAHMQRQLPDAIFTGHLEGEELARAVASADILVNPSVTEAFGNVNLEAMAAGLAIVSADVPSARALIVDYQSGLLVEAGDPWAYADAVEGLIRTPSERRRLVACAAAATEAYEWDAVLRSVLAVYLSLA